MVPILTQFVTRFYVNWYLFIDRKLKFYLESMLCDILGTLELQEEENLPNQDWAIFVGSPRLAIN